MKVQDLRYKRRKVRNRIMILIKHMLWDMTLMIMVNILDGVIYLI